MAIPNIPTTGPLCDCIDAIGTAIDNNMIIDINIPSNGLMTLEVADGGIKNKSIPYFSDFVISGITPTAQAAPNALDIDYTAGTYQINGVVYTLGSGGTLSVPAGDLFNDRIDIIYVTTGSAISYLAGTPAVNPVPPTLPANSLLVAEVGVAANALASSNPSLVTLTLVNIQGISYLAPGNTVGQIPVWNQINQKYYPSGSNILSYTNSRLLAGQGLVMSGISNRTGSGGVAMTDAVYEEVFRSLSGAYTYAMSGTATLENGRMLVIKVDNTCSSTNSVTLNAGSGTTIEGLSSFVLNEPDEAVVLHYNAANARWNVIGQYSTVNNLPAGTTLGDTLYWDGTSAWVETSELVSIPGVKFESNIVDSPLTQRILNDIASGEMFLEAQNATETMGVRTRASGSPEVHLYIEETTDDIDTGVILSKNTATMRAAVPTVSDAYISTNRTANSVEVGTTDTVNSTQKLIISQGGGSFGVSLIQSTDDSVITTAVNNQGLVIATVEDTSTATADEGYVIGKSINGGTLNAVNDSFIIGVADSTTLLATGNNSFILCSAGGQVTTDNSFIISGGISTTVSGLGSGMILPGNTATVSGSGSLLIGGAGVTLSKDATVQIAKGLVLRSLTTSTTPYTTLSSDLYININSSAGAKAVTLIATPETGRIYHIKRVGANNVTITPTAGNIDGAASYVLTSDYQSVTLVYTGSEWSVY